MGYLILTNINFYIFRKKQVIIKYKFKILFFNRIRNYELLRLIFMLKFLLKRFSL